MKTSRYTASLALLVLALLACASEPADPFLVQTDSGPVQGFAPEGNDAIAAFLGIPFATPPEGESRWRPPQPAAPWSEPLAASEYGPACPQPRSELPQSEDCLQLNVWTPVDRPVEEPLPVMVWIHGGGFVGGNGRLGDAPQTSRGAGLAARSVVVVSIQYRLGVLGFFAHPALTAEAEAAGEPDNNFGVLDMVGALEWVERNIGAFGGDPDRVTIFGVSAGGMAVNTLMSAPAAAGLFDRAIAQSGYGAWRLPHISEARWGLASARDQGAALIREADLGLAEEPSVADLRGVPFEDLIALKSSFWVPVVGAVLPDEPGIVFARGGQHDVPYITGGNSFEGTIFPAFGIGPDDYFAGFGEREQEARRLYGADAGSDADAVRQGAATQFGDQRYVISARYLAEQMKTVSSPGRAYYFKFVPEARRGTLTGAAHGSEVLYALGAAAASPDTPPFPGADGAALSEAMVGYWTRFAATGNPNGDGAPEWPEYNRESDQWMVLDAPAPQAEAGVLKDKLDLLEAVYLERLAGD